jgi:hypothetical protein
MLPIGSPQSRTLRRYLYATLAAQLTPHWFHEFYINRFGSGRSSKEVFPTYYRLNSEWSIKDQLRSCGFECEIRHVSIPPGYLQFSTLAFLGGILFERTFERTFPALRARLFAEGTKTFQGRPMATKPSRVGAMAARV